MEHAEVKPADTHTLMQIPDSDSSNIFCNGHDFSIAASVIDRDQRAPLGRSESQAIPNIRESSEEGEADRGGQFLVNPYPVSCAELYLTCGQPLTETLLLRLSRIC